MIDVTLTGSAALAPTPQRALAAACAVCQGRGVLFDCGEGTQTAARKAGVSLMKADVIALTHYHGDHIFGLPGLMQTMSVLGRTTPLTIVGPAGIDAELAPIMTLTGRVGFDIRLTTLPPEGVALNSINEKWPAGARLTAFPTVHRVPSQGYCLTLDRPGAFLPEKARALGVPVKRWGLLQRGQSVRVGEGVVTPDAVLGPPRSGLKLVFSGDTAACDSLADAAKDADLLICEATYAGDDQAELAAEYGHMVFSQAADIARRAGVRRLWLTHFSQMIEDPAAALPAATAIFPAAEVGEDGMKATLRFV